MDDIKKYYENYFDTYGDFGYRMRNSRDKSRVLFLKEFITKYCPEGGSVLDIGCGDMYLSTELPQFNWTGIDVTSVPSEGKAIVHDLMQTPYPLDSSKFDVIICSEVLEHVWDLRRVHEEVRRLLKKGGTYVVSTPNFDHIDYLLTNYRAILTDFSQPHLIEHIRQYNFEVHQKYLNQYGFRVIDYTGADAHFTHFFQDARRALVKELPDYDLGHIDQILGRMFPLFSHTIMLVCKLGS